MALCSQCGKQFDDSNNFCPYCGTAVNAQAQQPAQQNNGFDPNAAQAQGFDPNAYNNGYNNMNNNGYDPNAYNPNGYNPYGFQNQPAPASGNLNVGQLVWSILNIIFCCLPLGIFSLVMVIIAKGAATLEEENSKLKTAKTLNLIGTIVGGIITILYIVLYVVIFISAMNGEFAY